MNYLDVFLILIMLVAALRGYRRGLIKALTGLAGSIAAVFLAWQWSPSLALWLDENHGLKSFVGRWLLELLPLPQTVAQINPQGVPQPEWGDLLAQTGLPLILREGLISYWEATGINQVNSLAMAVSEGLAALLVKVLAFVVLFLLLLIFLKIIGNLLTAGISHSILGSMNRWGGMFFGLASSTLILAVILSFVLPVTDLFSAGGSGITASSFLVPRLVGWFDIFTNGILAGW